MDSSETKKQLLMNQDEFINRLLKNAYITQERLIALDSESAWIAFRLLDERKRLYDELYFSSEMRSREAAVKFILITYFVQQYNQLDPAKYEAYKEEEYGDLGHCRIKMAIDDLFDIIIDNEKKYKKETHPEIKKSLNETFLNTLKQCMEISLKTIKAGEKQEEPPEIKILKAIYKRLTGLVPDKVDNKSRPDLLPLSDNDLNSLSKSLTYEQLRKIRKRIHLNFTGILLIDVYKPVKYLSTAESRRKQRRIDGTEENQAVYLIPQGDRNTWLNNDTKDTEATVDISDYIAKNKLDEQERIFNVYELSSEEAVVRHAIDMLKKEMKIRLEGGNEEEDE
jgi:hypothetical protein